MKDISFKGIALGILAVILLDTLSGIALAIIFLENTSPEAFDALNKEASPQIFSIFFGTLSTIVGGYIAAKYRPTAPYKNSFIIGAVGFIIGVVLAENHTTWFNVIGFTTVIPSALLGGYLITRKSA